MRSRVDAAEFAEKLMQDGCGNSNKTAHSFGYCDLRALMDFIYEGEPRSDAEKIYSERGAIRLRDEAADKKDRFNRRHMVRNNHRDAVKANMERFHDMRLRGSE